MSIPDDDMAKLKLIQEQVSLLGSELYDIIEKNQKPLSAAELKELKYKKYIQKRNFKTKLKKKISEE